MAANLVLGVPFTMKKKKSYKIYWLLDSSFEMWFWYRLRYPSRLLANLGFGIRTKFGRTLPTAKSSMKKASVKATYQKKIRLYYEQSVKDSFYEVDQDAQVGRFFTKETFAELSTKRILL